jgi:hypothetical protein
VRFLCGRSRFVENSQKYSESPKEGVFTQWSVGLDCLASSTAGFSGDQGGQNRSKVATERMRMANLVGACVRHCRALRLRRRASVAIKMVK